MDSRAGSISQPLRVNADDMTVFANGSYLQKTGLEMLDMVLEVYGLQRTATCILVKNEHLLRRHTHPASPHLPKIGRMLHSLQLVSCEKESDDLFEALRDTFEHGPAETIILADWAKAMLDPSTIEDVVRAQCCIH